MHALLVTALFALASEKPVIPDSTHLVEVNHYYDDRGNLVFDQLIFWTWCENDSAHRVVAWRFIKRPGQYPRRDWRRGGFVTIWIDDGELRRVYSKSSRETWTQYDPEVDDRKFLRQEQRLGLTANRRSRTVSRPSGRHQR